MIYSVGIRYIDNLENTQRVVGDFNFDGRTKKGQYATFTHVPGHFTNWQVQVTKKTGPVSREMKACTQKDQIQAALEREIEKLLAEGNKTRTDPEYGVERERELADEALALEISDEEDAREQAAKASKGRVASGDALDAAARKAQAEKKIEEKIVAAHKRSNDMIGKVLSNDPELRRYITANTQPDTITNASIAEAAVGQGSDDLLEIPSFLKRS